MAASFTYFLLYFAALPLLQFIPIIVLGVPLSKTVSPDKDKRFLLLSYFVFVCLFVVDMLEASLSLWCTAELHGRKNRTSTLISVAVSLRHDSFVKT